MRIAEIIVRLYGPLQNLHISLPPGLQIIHGPNESGKTLLIDSLIKLLLGSKNIRDFEQIDRVPGMPEGHLRLLTGDQQHTLKAGFHLDKLIGLSPRDLRNLYIIRNKDLEMTDGGYLQSLSDRLTGMDTARMQKLRSFLMEAACLTNPSSSAKLSGSREAGQLALRLDKARNLGANILAYLERARAENLDQLELLLEESRQRLEGVEKSLTIQEQAQERYDWEQRRDLLAKYQDCQVKIQGLSGFTPQRRQQLQEIANHIATLETALQKDEVNLAALVQEQAQTDARLLEVQTKLVPIQNRKPALDGLYRRSLLAGEKQPPPRSSFSHIYIGGLMGLAFVAILLASLGWLDRLFLLTPPLAIITALSLLIYNSRLQGQQHSYHQGQQKLLQEAAAQGVLADTIQQLATALAREEDELSRNQVQVSLLNQKREDLLCAIANLQKTVRDNRRQTEEAKLNLEELLASAGVQDILAFSEQVDHQNALKATLDQVEDRLREVFGVKANWEQQFSLTPTPAPAQEEYDPNHISQLRRDKDYLQNELAKQKESLYRHHASLADFLNQYREIDVTDLPLTEFNQLEDLNTAADALKQFCYEIELSRDGALKAISVLEDLEAEEARRVADLVAPNRPVQTYFSSITQGRYTRISLEDGVISALRHDGVSLAANKLSQGTYDQLYLALRVSLGRELLGNLPGFYVLDDAFLCADYHRTEAMLELLKDLAEEGWQVIYLTKDHRLAAMAGKYTANSVIELNRLN